MKAVRFNVIGMTPLALQHMVLPANCVSFIDVCALWRMVVFHKRPPGPGVVCKKSINLNM